MLTLLCEILTVLTFSIACPMLNVGNYEPQESLECRKVIFYVGISCFALVSIFVLRNVVFMILIWRSSNPRRLLYCLTKAQLITDSVILLPGIPTLLFLSGRHPEVNECLEAGPKKIWVYFVALAFYLLVFYAFLLFMLTIYGFASVLAGVYARK